jgi:hypothetical protein
MDQKALDQALARFEGFRNNLPVTISESCVREYHSILDAITDATKENLEGFKIGDNQLEHKLLAARRRSFSGRPGRVTRSPEKSCDPHRFQSQIDGLLHYLERQGHFKSHKAQPPLGRADSRITHSVHIEHMHGSAIQQGTAHSDITIAFDAQSADFKSLIKDIKAKIPSLDLSEANTNQLYSDLATIEVQVASPTPKRSVIGESLSSLRAILENAAGNVIAVGIVQQIAAFLSGH